MRALGYIVGAVLLLIQLSGCSVQESAVPLHTIDQVKNNMDAEGLSLQPIDLPDPLISKGAVNQEAFRIVDSDDVVYLFEYEDDRAANKAAPDLHNALNEIEMMSPPMKIGASNIRIVYIKSDPEQFDIEQKLLGVIR
ncbi:MAG: hypothetical protein E6230_01125 [Paenibacillus dendritiformis]|uniref:hypothetical protein n=1 Tax=uncultured Paenibacillus sp. TaxID=227322 RepID=UPI0025E5CB9A|nr:hypothetical protein [uncultured Paenibacillus sp.]MDU5140770.1 hypothetical protein [Paenibacillus dendritiformis]